MYGIQTIGDMKAQVEEFENDVNMYGIQTDFITNYNDQVFENDVNMYGIQTEEYPNSVHLRLRMM